MTRSDLIKLLASKYNHLPYELIEDAVKHVFEQMILSLEQGKRIEIRGFGSFALRYRPPRRARNPKTGQEVETESKHSPHFKPGKEMRDRVNAIAALDTEKDTL
jgi:integration host factor subunit beta